MDCNAFICCGDFNTTFERSNSQTERLNSFIAINNLYISWNDLFSNKDFTYTNVSLNQCSCIDHIIITKKYFDSIVDAFLIF